MPLIETDGQWRYQYDANGNRTSKESLSASGETWSYTWDLHNRLINVTQDTAVSVSYAYDALNYRVRRDGKDGTTVYAYGRSGALTYQRNAQTGLERSFVYLNNQIIGWTDTIDGVSTTYYAITDHLGSVTAITDESGTVLWQSEYLPFGNLAGAEGEVRFEGLYTGKDIDSETGLTYHWNRWRSEDGSTFISEDPAMDGMNWYGYCGANPMNATDPTGLIIGRIIFYVGRELWKINYFEGLEQNYMPKDGEAEVDNIMNYIKVDESGKPYTDENGAAIFNDLGQEILGGAGWHIEAKDVFHEKDGQPVVKLLHEKGGEQIYDMMSGDLVTDPEFYGTRNEASGPYDDPEQYVKHAVLDVATWVFWGGDEEDSTSVLNRMNKLVDAKDNEYGSKYKNIEPITE